MFFRLLLLLTMCSLVLDSCTLSRRVTRNLPSFYDQNYFDGVTIPPSDQTFEFFRPSTNPDIGNKVRVLSPVMGLEAESLNSYLDKSATVGFAIIRNDTVLFERYMQGLDAEKPVTSFSVAKSFVGSMIGIAIEEGFINSTEDAIGNYLSDIKTQEVASVTIQQLLDHTSGIDFPLDGWTYYSRNLGNITAHLKMRREAGSVFRYENGNTQLLGMILEKATGVPLETYLSEKIWSRIGTESTLKWSVDSKKNSLPKAFCCLNARMLDFAKFGRLWLNGGIWDGQQIIPEDWVDASLKPNAENGAFIRYKNHMWLENEAAGVYFAAGLFGQYIYIYPPKNIIIVRFSHENVHYHGAWADLFGTVIAQL